MSRSIGPGRLAVVLLVPLLLGATPPPRSPQTAPPGPAPRGLPPGGLRVRPPADGGFVRWAYWRAKTPAEARKWVDHVLKDQLESLTHLCHLTPEQRAETERAAVEDVDALFKSAEAIRLEVLDKVGDTDRIQTIFEEHPEIPRGMRRGPFGAESKFLRKLDSLLSADQRPLFEAVRDVYREGGSLRMAASREGELQLAVDLRSTAFGDAGLVRLASAAAVRSINLEETPVTDEGISALRNVVELRSLTLRATAATDKSLAALRPLTKLQWLDLTGTQITDEGAAHLAPLRNLRALLLSHVSLGDAGVKQFAGLPELRNLFLDETAVGDEGLRSLKGQTKLEILMLNKTLVTDAGLVSLRNMTELQQLGLSGTAITDDGLTELKQHRKLLSLGLLGTAVTRDGVQQLMREAPNLTSGMGPGIDVHPSLKR